MINCKKCGKLTNNPKFCSRSCAAKINNIGICRNGSSHSSSFCKGCNILMKDKPFNQKYCSRKCKTNHQYETLILLWKNNKMTGLSTNGVVTRWVKTYLRKKYGNKCCLCGWNKINKVTNLVPLVADHIDGHWDNNTEDNLRLICPNCDALNITYGSLNRGNGRTMRRHSLKG